MKLPWDSVTQADGQRTTRWEPSDPRYHTTRWTNLSRRWRLAHPLCEECKRKGVIRAADCVDHIVPVPICKDFFDESNLQSLCRECNNLKGQRDKAKIQRWRKEHPQEPGQLGR